MLEVNSEIKYLITEISLPLNKLRQKPYFRFGTAVSLLCFECNLLFRKSPQLGSRSSGVIFTVADGGGTVGAATAAMLSLPLTPDQDPVSPPSVIWPHLLHHKEAGSWRLTDNPILTLYGRQCRHTPPIMSYYHMFIEYLPCPKTSCNTSPRPALPCPECAWSLVYCPRRHQRSPRWIWAAGLRTGIRNTAPGH